MKELLTVNYELSFDEFYEALISKSDLQALKYLENVMEEKQLPFDGRHFFEKNSVKIKFKESDPVQVLINPPLMYLINDYRDYLRDKSYDDQEIEKVILEVISAAVDKGADINSKDHCGCDLIRHAAFRYEDGGSLIDVIIKLKEAGLGLDGVDMGGNTTLMLLLKIRKDLKTESDKQNNLKMIEWLIDNGADLTIRDYAGNNPLIISALDKDEDTFNLIFPKVADEEFLVQGELGNNALLAIIFTTSQYKKTEEAEQARMRILTSILRRPNRAKFIKQKDSQGRSAISLAASSFNPKALKLIIDKGANTNEEFVVLPTETALIAGEFENFEFLKGIFRDLDPNRAFVIDDILENIDRRYWNTNPEGFEKCSKYVKSKLPRVSNRLPQVSEKKQPKKLKAPIEEKLNESAIELDSALGLFPKNPTSANLHLEPVNNLIRIIDNYNDSLSSAKIEEIIKVAARFGNAEQFSNLFLKFSREEKFQNNFQEISLKSVFNHAIQLRADKEIFNAIIENFPDKQQIKEFIKDAISNVKKGQKMYGIKEAIFCKEFIGFISENISNGSNIEKEINSFVPNGNRSKELSELLTSFRKEVAAAKQKDDVNTKTSEPKTKSHKNKKPKTLEAIRPKLPEGENLNQEKIAKELEVNKQNNKDGDNKDGDKVVFKKEVSIAGDFPDFDLKKVDNDDLKSPNSCEELNYDFSEVDNLNLNKIIPSFENFLYEPDNSESNSDKKPQSDLNPAAKEFKPSASAENPQVEKFAPKKTISSQVNR